jgi:K+-transporting ATPase ATPase A chain
MSFLAVPLSGWIQFGVFFAVLLLTIKPLGLYISKVLNGERVHLSLFLAPVEKASYWLCRVDPQKEMSGRT